MASTYVNDLRLNELATGDASGTWGNITNQNLELIAEAFSFGTEGITTNADTHTSTIADGATDPVRSMYVKYTGTLDSACTITIAPNTVSKLWFIENGTSGSQNIIISQGTGANVTIPAGDTKVVYSDGAGSGAAVVDAFASLSTVDLKVQDDLTVTDDASVGGDLLVSGEVQTANIGFTDGDNAITIADGGGITAANGITSTAAANSFGATSFNDANITNVGDIALDSLSADGSSISIASPVVINGTTPTLTIGDAGAEDTKLVFDGNAQDFYIGLDDSADDLLIGKGSTVGTTPALAIDENLKSTFSGDLVVTGDSTDFRGEILINNTSSSSGAHGAIKFVTEDESSGLIIGKHSSGFSEADLSFVFNELNTAMQFGTNNSEVMRLSNAGRLGVGTTNPSFAVDINADNGDQLRLDNDGDRFTQLTLANNGTTKANFNFDNTDSLAEIFAVSGAGLKLSTGGSERMRIDSGGDVRIGTTSQGAATVLTVSGTSSGGNGAAAITGTADNGPALNLRKTSTTTSSDARFIQFAANSGSTAMGAIVGNGASNAQFITLSDEREKQNITPVVSVLDKVMNLNVVSFDWIKHDEHIKAGFIAQNVEKYFPEYVVENVSDEGEEERKGTTGGMSAGYIAVLTKAIQEQQEQIEALQSEINTLKGG